MFRTSLELSTFLKKFFHFWMTMEKSLLLVQALEKCHLTEFKMKKLKTDSRTPILPNKNFINWLLNSKMQLPKVKFNKKDGPSGFMAFQSWASIFIVRFLARMSKFWKEVFKCTHVVQVMLLLIWQVIKEFLVLIKESRHQFTWLSYHLKSISNFKVDFSKDKNWVQPLLMFNDSR